MFTREELDEVVPLVRAHVPPTPQYAWPLLKVHTGVEVMVKHENHTPIGASLSHGATLQVAISPGVVNHWRQYRQAHEKR